MAAVQIFPNNPFEENTYIVYDETNECVIIDPGMYTASEQNAVVNFIKDNALKPVALLNTHCHIDHVLGNKLVFDLYGLKPQFHQGELEVLEAVVAYAPQFGLHYDASPLPDTFLSEDGWVTFGNASFQLIFCPGHSPAHLCFYDEKGNQLIGGDVLFRGSIGRSDLPGGNHQQLLTNIREKLFILPEDCVVYPGHGPATTIGFEKQYNPFFS
jgi:hydroxyacylglutathione hydrolase